MRWVGPAGGVGQGVWHRLVLQLNHRPLSSLQPGPDDTGWPVTALGQWALEVGLWVWLEGCRAGLPVAAVYTSLVLLCQRLEQNLDQQYLLPL